MNAKYKMVVAVLIANLTGCAGMTGYAPVLDHANDSHPESIAIDTKECEDICDAAIGTGTQRTVTDGAVGALGGSAAGALVGLAVGNPAAGAVIGASVAALGGGVYGGVKASDEYISIYNACMENRGHTVLNK